MINQNGVMMMSEMDDKIFAEKLMKALPTMAVPSALEARILADFDRLAARRQGGLMHFVEGWAERLWPGAPLWQPASVLALSLVIGLMAGVFVPSFNSASTTVTNSDQTLVADSTSVMDLYKDL